MPLSSDDPKFQRPVLQNNGPSLDPKKKPGDISMTRPRNKTLKRREDGSYEIHTDMLPPGAGTKGA